MSRFVVLLVALAPALAFAWGFAGHRRLSSLMQDALPAGHCLREWYAARQSSALQDDSCDPDRWRYLADGGYDVAEGQRHYLEIDWINPPSLYPREWDAAQARFGTYALKNGVVPWHVEALHAQLIGDFRARDAARILRTSFTLSHYVFDAFSVLHDTRNSDPNDGLHARWESDMLNVSANLGGVAALATGSYLGTAGRADPRYNLFDVILVGNGLVPQLVQADTAAAGSIPQLYTATRELTARRWGDGLTLMASLLWTAWAEAGSPELTGFTAGCGRAAPVAEPVLRGYPVPGGWLHAVDAGPAAVDGGVDAGPGDLADAGQGGGGGGTGEPPPPEGGCACSSGSGAAFVAGVALWLAGRRRRSERL